MSESKKMSQNKRLKDVLLPDSDPEVITRKPALEKEIKRCKKEKESNKTYILSVFLCRVKIALVNWGIFLIILIFIQVIIILYTVLKFRKRSSEVYSFKRVRTNKVYSEPSHSKMLTFTKKSIKNVQLTSEEDKILKVKVCYIH